MSEDIPSVNVPDNMPLDQAVPSKSKYLSKEDCEPPILVQIFKMTFEQIENDGAAEDISVLHFHGDVKPLVLKHTNKELLKMITGAQTAGDVKNHQIVLFNDPTIMFGKKRTGGIRIRSAQPVPAPVPVAPAPPPPGAPLPNRDPNDPLNV